jgi:DNA repair exonuclease SbcCD ATPase subunit
MMTISEEYRNMSNSRTIDKYQDILDSRDIIERIEELESEREQLADNLSAVQHQVSLVPTEDAEGIEAAEQNAANAAEALLDWDSDNAEELAALKALQDEAEGYCEDWKYGAALIRDSYFTDYAQELLQDIGDLPKDIPHYIVIDWEATARNIQQDYTSVEFDGVTYWVR